MISFKIGIRFSTLSYLKSIQSFQQKNIFALHTWDDHQFHQIFLNKVNINITNIIHQTY